MKLLSDLSHNGFIVVHAQIMCYQWRIQDYKRGANFCWPLVLTQRGAKPSFPIFLVCQKKIFLAKGGSWPNAPPLNTPLCVTYLFNQVCPFAG